MGNANRFGYTSKDKKPGPNQYKIDGFTDTMMKFYKKREELKTRSQMMKSMSNQFHTNANKTGFTGISKIQGETDLEHEESAQYNGTGTNYFEKM